MGRVALNSYQLISDDSEEVSTKSSPAIPPNTPTVEDLCDKDHSSEQPVETEFVPAIRWPDLIAQIFLHAGALYGICLLPYVSWWTILWSRSQNDECVVILLT